MTSPQTLIQSECYFTLRGIACERSVARRERTIRSTLRAYCAGWCPHFTAVRDTPASENAARYLQVYVLSCYERTPVRENYQKIRTQNPLRSALNEHSYVAMNPQPCVRIIKPYTSWPSAEMAWNSIRQVLYRPEPMEGRAPVFGRSDCNTQPSPV